MKQNINYWLLAILCAIGCQIVQAQGSDYMPLVREGVKWVHTEYYNCAYPDVDWHPEVSMGRLYRYEMHGDTVIDGTLYTKCYRISMSRDTRWGTMGNEMRMGLLCSPDSPAVCLRQEGRTVYYRMPGGSERILYDFESPNVIPDYNVSLSHGIPVEVAGYVCEVYEVIGYVNRRICRIIEGIGSVSEKEGELLYPVYEYPLGLEFSYHGLSHVEDANGDVIFVGPNYGLYDDETDLLGDVNRDGVVDVDDLNAAINEVFRFNEIWNNTTFGEDEEDYYVVPFKRAADLNNDGCVDISDVNAVVNIMVGK